MEARLSLLAGKYHSSKDYDMWCNMVHSFLRHLMGRYGEEEVIQWPIEVWNEPNLCGFWENADMQEYFKLFHRTFDAIKEVDPGFRVGRPCCLWRNGLRNGFRHLWNIAMRNHIPVDFVTRHHYTIDPPECIGHYAYSELMKAEGRLCQFKTTRDIIDSFPEYKGSADSYHGVQQLLYSRRASFMIQT